MVNRAFPRLKRRVNCDLEIEGRRYVGVALDLSPKGFFVQTTAKPAVGEMVRIQLRSTQAATMDLRAEIASRRDAPRRLAAVARSGVGCRLTAPPEDYYQFLASIS